MLRHPKRICREWEERRRCQWNDRCRFRHPVDHSPPNFLDLKTPNPPIPIQPPMQQQMLHQKTPQVQNPMKDMMNRQQYNLSYPLLFSVPPPNLLAKDHISNSLFQGPQLPSVPSLPSPWFNKGWEIQGQK